MSTRYTVLAVAYVSIAVLIAVITTAFYGLFGAIVTAFGFGIGLAITIAVGKKRLTNVAEQKYLQDCGSTRIVRINILIGALAFVIGTLFNIWFVNTWVTSTAVAEALGSLVGGVFGMCCGVIAARYFVGARAVRLASTVAGEPSHPSESER